MLTRENFGWRHQSPLPAGFNRHQKGGEGHQGLTRADIALEQPGHALRRPHIVRDFSDGAHLSVGGTVWQGVQELRLHPARGCRGDAFSSAVGGAREGEGQLMGEQFVIGQPFAGRIGCSKIRRALGRMGSPDGRPPDRPVPFGDKGCISPFGQLRGAVDRPPDGPGKGFQGDPLGEMIHRLEPRQVCVLTGDEDVIGVHHLQDAVVHFNLARNHAPAAGWKQPFEIVARGVEIDDLECQRGIGGVDSVRSPFLARRRVPADFDLHGRRSGRNETLQRRPPRPVDAGIRQMEQKVLGRGQTRSVERLGQFRPDPRQSGEVGKKGVERFRPAHWSPMSASQASSSIVSTPRSAAFFAFDPAPGPATSRSVRAETDPATLAPSASARALASARVILSRVPVKTTVLPATGLSEAGRLASSTER